MKETLKATWEEVMACPVGSKFKVISPAYTQCVVLMKHQGNDFLWKFEEGSFVRHCTKTLFIAWNRSGERWFLLEEENAQVVNKPVSIDSGIYCTCNGPSKKCDTGFSFSKVYYTCCNCKKEKQ